ncbi:hypothetical protein [Klebsiella variicola]|uniref:hypothetical protein n=1 Tax=Klebsiella variicola TaxID=244366 RepID=UPI001B32137C|nr:hypothetical protein [Klebsiella variicola]MBP5846717.1 hypothetical protein [Klebsiella variicola]
MNLGQGQRAGGPKLKVVEVQGEQLVVVQAAQEQGERYTLNSEEVTPYQEEGDFGVC